MDIKESKEILARNVLDLSEAGMECMPMTTVEIEIFEIMNKSKANPHSNETAWYERAHLIGLVDKSKKTTDLTCCSFMVKVWHNHYYRESFYGAMEVIEALRTVNGYKEPID